MQLLALALSVIVSSPLILAATNWTQYGYLPDPRANGPPCPIANNSYGWNKLKNADGSLYTASKRPIVVTAQTWDSFFINAHVMQYLLEIMGYQVLVAKQAVGYALGPDMYASVIDLFLESWPEDQANYVQMTQVDRVAIDLGATGYSGMIGLYVPTSLVNRYPEWGFDFWRFLLHPEARALLPQSGSTPPFLVDGKPQCDGRPKQCMNGTYTPAQCKVPGAKCVELWAYDPGYSPSNFQRIIDSMNLMVTMKFIGWSADKEMQAALDAGKDVFVYNWSPSVFVASNDITKVLFPATDHEQYMHLIKDRDNAFVSTDVPTIIIHKLSSHKFLTDFPELQSFANKYQILDAHMNEMLKSTVSQNLNFSQAACHWIQHNEDIWSPWIPKPPKSVDSCGVGFGRYFSGVIYSCISCPPGTFNWASNNTGVCELCPPELDCPGGAEVNAKNGIWMPSTVGLKHPDFYICPISSTCCSNGTCPPNTCSPSFTGTVCLDCSEPDHYLWHGKCTKCSAAGGMSFYFILVGAFFGAVLLLYLPYEEAPTVEILFFYFQVTHYIFEDQTNGLLSVPGLSTFLNIAALNIDGMVSDCTLPIKGLSKMTFRFFLPLLILFYIVAIYFLMRILQSTGMVSGESVGRFTPYYMRGQSLSLICFRATIVVLTFVVMPLIDASLILLQCKDILGKYVLTRAPEIQCFGSTHAPAAALAVIILIIFLGIVPLLTAVILRYLAKGDNIRYEEEGISNIQKLFQCLYIVFKPEMYWMMPVTIIEKGVVSILFTMLVKYEEMIKINVYILFLGFLCATRIYWQPYHNHLEAYLNREISLGILIMIAFRQFTDHYGVTTASLVQIGVVVFLPVVLHIIRWTRSNFEKHQDAIADVINSAKLTSKMSASTSQKGGLGSQNSLSRSQSQHGIKPSGSHKKKMRGSVEKLGTSKLRTASMLDRSRNNIANPNPREGDPLNSTQAP
ncbi:hypothetical protein BDR26DRAFT_937957 [Obelidium mucronatum]|nr:hypothetical protein BDR26DRAFT_937957 [Obelidium mucronatum]